MTVRSMLDWARRSRGSDKNARSTMATVASHPARTTATWPNPAPRPEIRADDETLLVLVGSPSIGHDKRTHLESSVGAVALEREQAIVAGTLIIAGAWASAANIAEVHAHKLPGMLDAGMLYAFNLTDKGFYRELIPRKLTEQFEIDKIPESVFDMLNIRVPRGSGTAEFPAIVVPVLDAIDGHRSAGEIADEAISVILRDLRTTSDALPSDQRADLEELRGHARLSLILAAQSGLVELDLPA